MSDVFPMENSAYINIIFMTKLHVCILHYIVHNTKTEYTSKKKELKQNSMK